MGGFILSARALAPARLAYTRQQRFIADVSHELRTPLTLLRANAEMLLRGRAKFTEDDAEMLDDIVDETARLAALTSNLLTLARLDSSNRLPERETIDLAEVAAQVARRTTAFASERQVTVNVAAEPGLLLTGARNLIDQAALILVDNGIKYNHPGGAVDVRAERRGDRVALIVQRHGRRRRAGASGASGRALLSARQGADTARGRDRRGRAGHLHRAEYRGGAPGDADLRERARARG